MRKTAFCFLLLLLTSSLRAGEHDFDFEYWSKLGRKFAIGPVTTDQAKQAIINWSGRQNLNIELGPIYYWDEPYLGRIPSYGFDPSGGLSPDYITWYAFGVKDPNPDKKYYGTVFVDSWTGEVKGFHHSSPERLGERSVSGMLTPQQAKAIATQIVLSYFPNIPVNSMEVDFYPDLSEDGNSWKEPDDEICVNFITSFVNPYGEKVRVKTQEVHVWIDSYTGELTEIFACYEPLEVSPVRSLTYEEIAQAVISFFYGIGAEDARVSIVGPYDLLHNFMCPDISENAYWRVSREEPNGPQRLYTFAHFWAKGPNFLEGGLAFVDGHTGEIIYAYSDGGMLHPPGLPKSKDKKSSVFSLFFNGAKREPVVPPIMKDGKLYISVEDVNAMGFKVGKKGYAIGYKAKRAYLEEGDVIRENGRRYIRGEALGKLKGVIARYIEEENQFHIVVLNEELFKKGQEYKAKLEEKENSTKSGSSSNFLQFSGSSGNF